jgi:hypothetical protein
MILSRDRQFRIAAMAAAGAVGLAFGLRPLPVLGVVVVLCSVIFALVLKRCLSSLFLACLGIVLLGYAFLGRGFAYLGVHPIYVGEIVALSGRLGSVFGSRLACLLVAFSIWGAIRTIPFIPTYGADALRDGAMWGYGAFAVIVASCIRQQRRTAQILSCFGRLVPYFLTWIPLAWCLVRLGDDVIPTVPGNEVKLLVFNPAMMAVHLAGVAPFLLLDLGERRRARGLGAKWALATLWAVGFLIVASITRGGLLTALTSVAIVALFRPVAVARRIALACLFAGLTMLVVPALLVGEAARDERLFEDSRTISPGQIAANLTSVFSNRGDDLEGTRQFRLLWWRMIIDYTVFGEYFWTGKGFGINIADDDGFPTTVGERRNRSPHNCHLTMLARAGVPGAALWVLLQGAFGAALVRAYFRAWREQREWHARVTLWILAYWGAFMTAGAFDVFLEGPYGGISFWSLFGLGIAVLHEQRSPQRTCGELHRAYVDNNVTHSRPSVSGSGTCWNGNQCSGHS